MIEIVSRQHFNEIIVSLNNCNDFLKNIDQLCNSVHVDWNKLSTGVRQKAPELVPALSRWTALIRCTAAGSRNHTGNKSFVESALAKNFITVEMVEAARSGKEIAAYSGNEACEDLRQAEARRIKLSLKKARNKERIALAAAQRTKKLRMPTCPCCGKKTESLATHSCRKTSGSPSRMKKSIWVISGGGANGIRNKR